MKRLLLAISLLLLSQPVFATNWCDDASCVGCWLMEVDEDPQSDSSGEGHTAAVVNAVYTTTTPPASGDGFDGTSVGYFYFDGSGDYLNGTEELVTDGWTGGWTVTAWVKSPDGSTRRFILETSPSFTISLGIQTDGTLQPYVETTGTPTFTQVQSTGQVDDGTWHHVCGTFSSVDYKVRAYIDGVLDGTSTASGSATLTKTDGVHIGTYRSANDRWMNGNLDEVAVFSEAKDSTDINSIMEGLAGAAPPAGRTRRFF